MQFVIENKTVILAALLAISEVLALIPGIKANGIFDGIVKALTGGSGQGASTVATSGAYAFPSGGMGAASFFGGAGGGGGPACAGAAAATNSGSGGGGGGTNGGVGSKAGGGGSAGGYVDAIITSPSSTYAYAVGAGGSGGAGLNGAFAGGAGGSGFIEVTEYYQ